jgi:predicted amidophosphoribosyltransferase
MCAGCTPHFPCFEGRIFCWLSKAIGRPLILTLKYRTGDFLEYDIAVLLKDYCGIACESGKISLLVPFLIPHFRSVKQGYNQAKVIAYAFPKSVHHLSGVNTLRIKDKRSQIACDAINDRSTQNE